MTGQTERRPQVARRKSYQKGTVFKRGRKGSMVWVGRWWEDGIGESGSPCRVRRSQVLGTVAEIRTRRKAQLRLDQHLAANNLGRKRPEAKMKFRDFAEGRWMKDVLPAFKFSTQLQYTYFMAKYLLPYFGNFQLEEIRPEEVQRFLAQWQRLAPKTVRSMASALSSSFRTAVNWGFVDINPVRAIALPPKRNVRARRALTPEEVKALLRSLKEPCRTMVILMLLTGMRIGEALALRWGKVDFKNRTILVNECVYEGELSTPKTESGIRGLPMSDLLAAELQRRHGDEPRDPNELVFPNEIGGTYCRRNLMHRYLKPAAEAAGIGNIGWHVLRRTHSTWLKDVGAAPGVIQHQLGHSDPRLAFELYVMSVPGERRKAVERVSTQLKRLLDPNSTHGVPPRRVALSAHRLKSAG
jgi:integrase